MYYKKESKGKFNVFEKYFFTLQIDIGTVDCASGMKKEI